MVTMAGEKTTSQGYPGKVCILDLETSKLVKGEPEATPLAFVGTMVYELHDGRYRPGPHRCFLTDELGRLEELLRDFEGMVLGHNILNFDYEVLKPHISLEGVPEKTVDTLGFLYDKRSTEPLEFGGPTTPCEGSRSITWRRGTWVGVRPSVASRYRRCGGRTVGGR